MRQGKTKADPDLLVKALELESLPELVKEAVPGPASNWGINPEESIQLEPEASYSYYASKKDKKKRLKLAKGSFSFREELLRLTTDPNFEPETILTTKRDKYLKRYSRVYLKDFNSLTFLLLASRNNHDKTCELAKHFDLN